MFKTVQFGHFTAFRVQTSYSVTVQFKLDPRIWYTRYIINGMVCINCWINGIKWCYPRCRKRYCQRQDGSLRVEQYELFRISNWISFNWSIVSIFIFCQTNHSFAQFRRTHKELKTSTLTQPLWLILTVYFQPYNLGSIGRQRHNFSFWNEINGL